MKSQALEYETLIRRIPMERTDAPADVAGGAHDLRSPDAAAVTSAEHWVTGGQHLY